MDPDERLDATDRTAAPFPDGGVHAGDTRTLDTDAPDPTLRLAALDGHLYTVLDGEPYRGWWRVVALRLVASGDGMLPLRPESDAVTPAPYRNAPAPGQFVPDGGHLHRHAHHGGPRNVLPGWDGPPLERYDHTHPHTHATLRDDRAYHDDHAH
jgi:hypothetical protein